MIPRNDILLRFLIWETLPFIMTNLQYNIEISSKNKNENEQLKSKQKRNNQMSIRYSLAQH